MKFVGFALAVFLYIVACYLGIRGYFAGAGYLHQRLHNKAIRSVLLYPWFLAFVVVEVPFGIFFPAWLSEKWSVFPRTPGTTTGLLLFGSCCLALAAWRSWRSAEVRRVSEIPRH